MVTSLTVSRRVTLGFVGLLALLLFLGASVWLREGAVADQTRLAGAWSAAAMDVNDLRQAHDEVHNRAWAYVQSPAPPATLDIVLDAAECSLARWVGSGGRAELLALDPTLVPFLDALWAPHAAYHDAAVALAATHDPAQALAVWTNDLRPSVVRLRAVLHDLQRVLSAEARARTEAAVGAVASARRLHAGLVLFALAVGGLAAWRLRRGIRSLLRGTVAQVTTASGQLAAVTREQVVSAEEQGRASRALLDVVDRLRVAVRTTAEGVDDITARAREVEATAADGRRAVTDTGSAMEAVRQRGERVAALVLELAGHVQVVEDVVSAVDGLTGQTHLLALNAAVEAARTGDATGGFGVIATEIRALSERSRVALRQITTVLTRIQKATHDAVLSVEDSSRAIDTALVTLQGADGTIQQLSLDLSAAARAAARVVDETRRQHDGVDHIETEARRTEAHSRQEAEAARQVGAAAQDLDRLAHRLALLVDPER